MLNEMYYFKEDKSAFSKRFEELMKKNNLKLNDVVEIFEEKTKTNSYELIKKWRYGERLPDIESISILAGIFHTTMEDLYLSNSHLKIKKNRYSDIFSFDDERLDLLNDFSKESIKTKLEINKDDDIKILQEQADFIEEINYLLQKKLFSFLTSIEEAKLRWCFKYFILDRDYKKIEYDIFWNEINKNMINKMGTAYKYKISYSDMKAEYFEFKKKIIFAPNYKFVYSYDFLNDLNDEMVIKAYLARYDEVSLNVLYTDSDTSPKVKAILKNMGCKKINGCLFESDILSNIDKMDYLDYLGKIDERSND